MVVACLEDGLEMRRQMARYDGIYLTDKEFGLLHFVIDVSYMPMIDINSLIDDLQDVDATIDAFVECGKIEFEYFITPDLLPILRGVVDKYCYSSYYDGKLLHWKYGD